MSFKRVLTCINCPTGCELTVTQANPEAEMEVTGGKCKRGKKYAINEITDPKRMLTTTVKIKNGLLPYLPVMTVTPIPKDEVMKAVAVLKTIEVEAPVHYGDIICHNVAGLGSDVMAARDM